METVMTKLVPPLEPLGLLDRPRLRERLASIERHRVTVVHAAAGYGKTTLLAQWFDELKSQGAIASWLTVDARERSPSALVVSIAAMLEGDGRLGAGIDVLSRNDSFFETDAAVATLVERLAAGAAPVYLFLDDLHAIGREAAVLLADLVQRAPHNTHFVVATRDTNVLELAAMRAYGQLLEIGHADLCFTSREAAALMAGAGHTQLEPADIEALVAKTEGWVTGLKLASFAMNQRTDTKAFLNSFSGRRRAVAAFFAEDVFARQSDDVRRFLLDTAVLDRLSPALCDAVTGRRGASTMLRHLEAIGLFIVALDDEEQSYRYHSLFAEFLQRKLADFDPLAADQQHHRAALWLAEQGAHGEALEHALRSRDFALLSSQLESIAEDFIATGRLYIVAKYAAHLPRPVLASSPWTLAAVAWLKLRGLRFGETRRLLDLASAHLERLRQQPDVAAETLEALERTIEHREMMLAAAQDDPVRVERMAAPLMHYFAPGHPFIACTIQAELITAQREQFRLEGLDRLHRHGRATAEESGYRFAEIGLEAAAGATLFAAGRTDAAWAALEHGLAEAQHWAGRNSRLAAMFALPLAEIAYEGNDLSLAAKHVANHLPVARELCFVDQLMAGYLVESRLASVRGDANAARMALDEGMSVAHERDLERLRLTMLHEQVRLSLRAGQPVAAMREAADGGIPTAREDCLPNAAATSRDEARAMIHTRICISQDHISDALAIAKAWQSFCRHRGAVRSLVRWQILSAQALLIEGALRASQRVMREAIASAAPAHMIRSFVDEGPVVLTILSEAYRDSMQAQHPTDQFAQIVLAAFNWRRPVQDSIVAPKDGLYGRLSVREIEILTLVAHGMRNREIGDRMGLSEGSVKWYMQQVYDKIGIRRRSQAVERARQFGLMA